MNNIPETMIRTGNGFPVCKIVKMSGGEPGIQVKAGKKVDTMSLYDFLNEYISLYNTIYANCVSETN